ncbi:MAG: hydrogenase maturation protease [Desulfovermiculus sp.]
MAKLMILGLGNVVQQDKGLGIYAVRDLYHESWPMEVMFVDRMMLGDSPLNLNGVRGLLVLDAWQTGRAPGTLMRLNLDQVMGQPDLVPEPLLWRALALADVLGQNVEVVFLGLEAENTDCNLMLSPPVHMAYPSFLELVRQEISCMLSGLCPRIPAEV